MAEFAGRTTTRLQVSAQRFHAARMERALRCGRATPDPTPGRGALGRGAVAALIVTAVAAVLAAVHPRSGIPDAPLVLDRATGALYVRVRDTVHPVLNLASARLIAGAVEPRPVDTGAVGRARRGPPLGIPGAPGVLGTAVPDTVTWSLCDGPAGTTLLVGADPSEAGTLDPRAAIPVRAEAGAVQLIRGGRRVAVAPGDPGGDDPGVRPVSALLLNAIPEAASAGMPDTADRMPALSARLCVHWRADAPDRVTVSNGSGLPEPAAVTALAQADGPGPALDGVYLPPGRIAYVRAADSAGQARGAGYLIADSGVRFTIGDDEAARSLGLPAAPTRAPWAMLAGLPAGPRLSRDQALLARDVVPAP